MLVKENPDRKKKKEKKGICQKYQKVEIVSEITRSKGIPQGTNLQYIKSLTEKWIEMAPLLGNTKILFEPHPE